MLFILKKKKVEMAKRDELNDMQKYIATLISQL